MDASTLGKIDLQGPDVGVFLDRIYTNRFSNLAVGACRYGLMCRADGMVFDDGVTSRLSDDRWHMTTTTGNAAPVLEWLEEWLQTEWPDFRVHATSVTEQWATIAVGAQVARRPASAGAGPAGRGRRLPVHDRARGCRRGRAGSCVPHLVLRGPTRSTCRPGTGTRCGSRHGRRRAVRDHALRHRGDARLRAEKGYPIVGQETDGTVTPIDLGMDWIVSKQKSFVGKRSLSRSDTARSDRKQLVGLLPDNPSESLPEGAQLVLDPSAPIPMPMVGHVTSSYRARRSGGNSRWR